MFESFQYCYLSKVRFVLFVPIQTFFWSANCAILVCNYSFSCFILVCKLYIRSVNKVCISSHILNMGNVLFEGFQYLVFQFLAFLSILSLLFLGTFPDLEILKFWSVNYICQVCRLFKASYFQLQLNICCVAILLKTVFCCTFWRQKILIL